MMSPLRLLFPMKSLMLRRGVRPPRRKTRNIRNTKVRRNVRSVRAKKTVAPNLELSQMAIPEQEQG